MKLFLKIFLWFLAAIALMVGVVIFVTRTFQTEPMFSRWQRAARNQMTIYGGTSVQIYESQGEQGLRAYIARLHDSETLREIDLIDTDGRPATGDVTNLHDFDGVIEKARASGSAEIDVSPADSALGAAPIAFSDGKHYVLIVRWSPPRTPSLFFDSWLGYLRLIGLLLTAGVVCYALALYLTSPIRKIRDATHQLADGDLQARVAERMGRRRDELADLARDFDIMAERIESLITSQQRLTQDVSHELRSPLARMNVALEIAKQKSNAETAPVLERIEKESERLNEMISRILILSKLESGADDLEHEWIDLKELVEDVAADANFEAQAKGKSAAISRAERCNVVGNDNLLRSAVENVLRNAVRYTADGTVVDISLETVADKAVIRVVDHGGGVPEDELSKIFRPFYRVGEARERKTGGIGLGLAIAERAIHATKGKITARNTGDGLSIEMTLSRAETGPGRAS